MSDSSEQALTIDSAWRKLNRARHHYDILCSDLEEGQRDALGLEWITAYNGNKRIIAASVSPVSEAVIGSIEDTLSCARVSLERVVHAAVEQKHRRGCKFPIWSNGVSASWRQQVKGAVPGQQASWLRAHLEGLEPWPGGCDAWLYWLHHLNIADKHHDGFTAAVGEKERTVTFLVERVHPDVWRGSEPQYVGELTGTYIMPDPIFPLRPRQFLQEFAPDEAATVKAYEMSVYLAFGPESGLEGEPVLLWIQRMLESLDSLLGTVEALAPGDQPAPR